MILVCEVFSLGGVESENAMAEGEVPGYIATAESPIHIFTMTYRF
jgi:hypothetical protein